MGIRKKEHRAKVAKRNRVIAQKKYSMQNAFNKMMEKMAQEKDANNLQVKLGDDNVPFEVVTEPTNAGIKGFEFEGNVSFKEENPELLSNDEVVPEYDGAGFSIEDRGEEIQDNEQ